MKKLWALLSPLGVILITLVVLYLSLTPITAKLISSSLGIPVGIQKASLFPPIITLKGFTIENLKGLNEPVALRIGQIMIDCPYTQYFKHVTKIRKVELNDIDLVIEFFGNNTSQNNWSLIISKIDSHNPKSADDLDAGYSEIQELRITNLKVKIIRNGKITETVIPEIVLHNVKTKNGELMQQVAREVIYQMIFNIKNIINIPLQMSKDALNDALQGVPNLLFPGRY